MNLRALLLLIACCTITACGAPKLKTEPPKTDQQSELALLQDIKAPAGGPILVGVYNFTDQTGQRAVLNRPVAEMSSAIPQGLSAILVQELQRAADGGLYRVVERENIDSVLNERRIAAATLGDSGIDQLGNLLLPGILLMGGAVSYDRNVIQKMNGASFGSVSGSKELVSDEVGVILRAVSVKTGEVLASVHARKSVLSTQRGIQVMSIINNDVLALESGGSANEPVSLATRLAIAAAVAELTKTGIAAGWWK